MEERGRDRLSSGIWERALARDDQMALELLEDAVEALGAGVASAVNLLDPEAVVIGGGLGIRLGEPWVERIREAMMPHLFVRRRPAAGDAGRARRPRRRARRRAAGRPPCRAETEVPRARRWTCSAPPPRRAGASRARGHLPAAVIEWFALGQLEDLELVDGRLPVAPEFYVAVDEGDDPPGLPRATRASSRVAFSSFAFDLAAARTPARAST